MRLSALFRTCCLLSLVAPGSVNAAPLRVSVSGAAVTISSATPRGEVLLVGLARTVAPSSTTYRTYNIGLTASATGEVTWQSPQPVESGSGWLVVDIESGKYVLTNTIEEGALAEVRVRKDKDGHWRKLEPKLAYVRMIIVRPKRGSWHLSAGDGGKSDRDGLADGKIELDVDDFIPQGKTSGHLAKIEDDDLILALSPESGSVLTLRAVRK